MKSIGHTTLGHGGRSALLGVLLAGCASVPAFAQSAQPSAAPNPAPSQAPVAGGSSTSAPPTPGVMPTQTAADVADIVVTAQKRSESINRVGLSITAITGDALQQRGIRNVADLAAVTPGLTFATTDTSTPVYTLRGVGFYENSLAAYPAVSVYVDEIPLPFPVLTSEAGLDVERVEVLKGPQGILFGQNSTGGAINYIARKPTDHFEAGAGVGFGRFNDINGSAYLSGPLAAGLRARLSVQAEHADDWQYSYTRNDSLGEIKKISGRLIVDWDASDRLRFEVNANGFINRSDPQAPQYFEFDPTITANIGQGTNGGPINAVRIANSQGFAPHNDRAADWSPGNRPSGNERMGQVALRSTFDASSDVTVTSITAYTGYRRRNRLETDGQTLSSLDLRRSDGDITSFTQELRAANASSNPLRWLVGGNVELSKIKEYDAFTYPDSTVTDFLVFLVPAAKGYMSNDYYSNQKTRNYAGFINLDYDVVPQLTVKTGARYTHSWRNVRSCSIDSGDGTWAKIVNFLNGYTGAQLRGPGSCTTALPTATGPQPIDAFRDTLREHNVSWRFGIDYRLTGRTLLYANVAQGYKAGSFPTASATSTVQLAPVKQERIRGVEAGVKTRTESGLLSVTAAGYYYDYSDKQIRGPYVDPVFGVLDRLTNIPKSSIRGGELEAVLRPMQGLVLTAVGAYTDAKIDRYTAATGVNQTTDYSGSPIPFNSKYSATAAADYNFAVSERLNGFLGGTVTYKSRSNGALNSANDVRLNPYVLVDLRAGVETAGGHWRLSIYGKNVTNKYYYINTVHAFDTNVRYTGRPATYGATLAYRY